MKIEDIIEVVLCFLVYIAISELTLVLLDILSDLVNYISDFLLCWHFDHFHKSCWFLRMGELESQSSHFLSEVYLCVQRDISVFLEWGDILILEFGLITLVGIFVSEVMMSFEVLFHLLYFH